MEQRADPNLLHWQRVEHARAAALAETARAEDGRRPPSYGAHEAVGGEGGRGRGLETLSPARYEGGMF